VAPHLVGDTATAAFSLSSSRYGERRARATTAIRSDAWARLRVSNFKKEGPYVGWIANHITLKGILPGWALSVELPALQSFR
jgi:hypothetical protein